MKCAHLLVVILFSAPFCIGQQDDNYYEDYNDLYSDETETTQQSSTTARYTTTTSQPTTTSSGSTVQKTTPAARNQTQRFTVTTKPIQKIVSANIGGPDETGEFQTELIEIEIPDTCKGYKMMLTQPALLDVVQIPKCCKVGESYYFDETGKRCSTQDVSFDFDLVHAVFYEGCIEDREVNITYEIVEKPPCEGGLLYNVNYGDLLYVMSNGSLLRVGSNWDYYDIFDDYCVDMVSEYGEESFVLSAISCRDKDLPIMHVSRIQAMICAVFMMISVPCLIAVAFIYFVVDKLNDLHGKSLAMHSLCLATGYLLLAFIQFTGNYEGMVVGYIIQYSILACFFWLLMMVSDISWQIWRYLPRNLDPSEERMQLRFRLYTAISQCTPLVFVFLSYIYGYHGIPSYFLRAVEYDDLDSQKFFIPVVTFILVSAILLSIANRFGYKNLQTLNTPEPNRMSITSVQSHRSSTEPKLDTCKLEKVETMKISTTFLLTVMTVTWLCEIISFYFTSAHISPILFLDIINALQGVFIFLLFVCLPKPFKLIKYQVQKSYNDNDVTESELRRFIGTPQNEEKRKSVSV